MDIRKLTGEVSVCGQLAAQDMALVGSLGFGCVICNRPDGESPDQPRFKTIREAAGQSGIGAFYLPVPPDGAQAQHIAALRHLWADLPKPVLVFSRSGGRSRALVDAALQLNQSVTG